MEMKKDLKKCVDYHGHLCGGLLMGYRAARAAMKNLKARLAKDEELVAIVENSACFVDAVGVLTGCTFGKGNLLFKDYGKMVLFLLSRKTGRGVRVSFDRKAAGAQDQRFPEVMNKVLSGKATPAERLWFRKTNAERQRRLISAPDRELLRVRNVKVALPPRARIFKSLKCVKCGELAMEGRHKRTKDGLVCLECLE